MIAFDPRANNEDNTVRWKKIRQLKSSSRRRPRKGFLAGFFHQGWFCWCSTQPTHNLTDLVPQFESFLRLLQRVQRRD